jgi:hypothetical protein
MGHYYTAQICKNGHVITANYGKYSQLQEAFCDKCGAATIIHCEGCNKAIRGRHDSGIRSLPDNYSPPRFCPNCGKPYPWTASKLRAAKELVEELDGLDANDRRQLGQSLDDLVAESPKTDVASSQFKQIMKKVGKESYDLLKKVVTDLVSESIRKTLFGP